MIPSRSIDVSASNILGLGASELVRSLLPALDALAERPVRRLVLPDRGPLAGYEAVDASVQVERYHRRLPNAISRALECTIYSGRIARSHPLLVLGDLPVRSSAPQVVFVQSPHLTRSDAGSWAGHAKYAVSRAIFRSNCRFVTRAIVQTPTMQRRLALEYPLLAGRVDVVAQPPPAWLLHAARQQLPLVEEPTRLRLFYPAAGYPHKNHALIWALAREAPVDLPVQRIEVTIDGASDGILRFLGQQDPAGMLAGYNRADAILFPSLEESYGLPLVEAMFLGLPIIVSDRPFAHDLCGNQAIYFNPTSVEDLIRALREMSDRLAMGWRPDWSTSLERFPCSWEEVARRMLGSFEGLF